MEHGPIAKPRKLTVAVDGVTLSRRSPRPYTHVVIYWYTGLNGTEPRWIAASWHQGPKNAAAGLVAANKKAARFPAYYQRVTLREVDQF